MTWDDYLKNTKEFANPRKLLVEALPYVKNKNRALDLGAGALKDTRYLLENGFAMIDVVDSNPSVKEIANQFPEDSIEVYILPFHEFNFQENAYDLINAQYSLPFAGPEHIGSVLDKLKTSLNKEGVFTGQFFGIEDEWNDEKHPEVAFHTKVEIEEIFPSEDWNVIKLFEEKADRPTAAGEQKHWHVFHVIAYKLK